MHYRGGTLDTMVLAGLVIALGEVVDDAIDVENIVRRLRLNSAAEHPQPAIRVVLDASMEVRSAVLYGSLIVVVVFVPVFMLDGWQARSSVRWRCPTSSPSSHRLRPHHYPRARAAAAAEASGTQGIAPGRRSEGAISPHAAFLRRPAENCARVVGGLLLVTALTVPLGRSSSRASRVRLPDALGGETGHVDRGDATHHRTRQPRVDGGPGVRNFGAHIGRAEVADEVVGPNFTELWVSLDPSVDYEATVAKIQSIVDGYPGLYRDLLTYLRERIKEVLTGASATIVVRVYGPDLEGLQAQAQAVWRWRRLPASPI